MVTACPPAGRALAHALIALASNGERSRTERAWTAECRCGWAESTSTKAETMNEYRAHLRHVRKQTFDVTLGKWV
jgi:hypothetical protein